MVLERLFPEDWLEKKFRYAFLLGFSYSIIGIIIARFLFPSNSGIVSVIFTSVFLIPSMRKIFSKEEKSEEKAKKFSIKKLYFLDYDVVFMYFLIFFGIFLSYTIFSFLLPQFGVSTFNIFKEQLFLDPSLKGRATFSASSFISILYNNWWVLLATFMLALVVGDGAIFFVAWNASAWGTLFGARALHAAVYSGQEPWLLLFQLLLVVIWHVILEGGAYILAGIAGSTISHEIIKEKIEIKEFLLWIFISAFLFFMFKFIINSLFIGTLLRFIIYFVLTFILLHFLGNIVAEKKNKQVYTFNFMLFIVAISIFFIGAIVEVFVLSNSPILSQINIMSFCYSNEIPFEQCLRLFGI